MSHSKRFGLKRFGLLAIGLLLAISWHGLSPALLSSALAQSGGAIQLKASRVEANSNTGVVTAIGNVRIDYPSRQIFATSAQALYYSREQRIVLSGNVDVVQEGNTLQAETVTYLIEEGRFVATPGANSQVEAVYLLPEEPNPEPTIESVAPVPAPLSIPAVPDELPAELGPIDSP
ncbi:MAG: LptA/OstA family protein [Cyanobacteria bacterium J06634_5]